MRKKFTIIIQFCFCLILLFAVLIAVDYLQVKYRIENVGFEVCGKDVHEKFKSSQVSSRFGSLPKSKNVENFFLNFNPKKESGKIRVGIFGDCNILPRLDSGRDSVIGQLQHKFDSLGLKNVEVLSFGMIGFSIHEMFDLWKVFAEEYGLDFALIGPKTRNPGDRDLNFFSLNGSQFDIRGRYILKSEHEIEYKQIDGDCETKLRRALSIFPPLNLIRFNRALPPGWVRLFNLPSNTKNPFYYLRNMSDEEERTLIIKNMMDLMSKSTSQSVVFLRGPEVVQDDLISFSNSIHNRDLHILENYPPYSGTGKLYSPPSLSERVANIYYNMLVGNEHFTVDVLEPAADQATKDYTTSNQESELFSDWSETTEITAFLDSEKFGILMLTDEWTARNPDFASTIPSSMKTLLITKSKFEPAVQSYFFSIPSLVNDGDKLILNCDDKSSYVASAKVLLKSPRLVLFESEKFLEKKNGAKNGETRFIQNPFENCKKSELKLGDFVISKASDLNSDMEIFVDKDIQKWTIDPLSEVEPVKKLRPDPEIYLNIKGRSGKTGKIKVDQMVWKERTVNVEFPKNHKRLRLDSTAFATTVNTAEEIKK